MHPPDDLEDYLRGDSALSREYRRESAAAPPHALDRQVLKLSRESPHESSQDASSPQARSHAAHGSSRSPRAGAPYLAPLAFAASVLLSVALVLAIVFGPQTAKHVDEAAPRLMHAVARADAPRLRLYSSDPQLVRSASAWLGDIAALRRAGRNREADAEFRLFRSAYPDYRTAASDFPP
jgi:hypothetical protein